MYDNMSLELLVEVVDDAVDEVVDDAVILVDDVDVAIIANYLY